MSKRLVLTILVATALSIPLAVLLAAEEYPFLAIAVLFSSCLVTFLARDRVAQFFQRLYSLSEEEALSLINNLAWLSTRRPIQPILRVQEGRVLMGAEQLQQAGGPGYLSVGHDSAVITSQYGVLRRVLGPGFYRLAPFERVWDVIDLRPQHRTITVHVMTRDGIPARCDVSIRFRIDDGGMVPTDEKPFPFTEETVFKAAMSKRSRGGGSYQDWTARLTGGVLDGEVRNRLEMYNLDDFLPPAKDRESLLDRLEREIFNAMVTAGEKMGVKVEEVRLSPVLPEEEAVSRQWLEAWQAEWDRIAANRVITAKAEQLEMLEQARIRAEAELVDTLLSMIKKAFESKEFSPELLRIRTIEMLRSVALRYPMDVGARHALQRIAESVLRESQKRSSRGNTPVRR